MYLERYGVNVELTSTLRCAYHKYTFRPQDGKKVLADMTRNNNRVSEWAIGKEDSHSFSGYQDGDGKMYFYAVSNYEIDQIGQKAGQKQGKGPHTVSIVTFKDSKGSEPLELKIGFSFVSTENARMNLEAEMLSKDFSTVCAEAGRTWEDLLSRIQVKGGTERHLLLMPVPVFPLALPQERRERRIHGPGRECRQGRLQLIHPAFFLG